MNSKIFIVLTILCMTFVIANCLEQDQLFDENPFYPNIITNTPNSPGDHVAVIRGYNKIGPNFNGVSLIIDAYTRKVEAGQRVTGQIWINAGPREELNALQIGWMVAPDIYGDTDTHFFTHWTADNYQKTGCFDTSCSGFVPYTGTNSPDQYLSMNSSNDRPIYGIKIFVYQDFSDGKWWVKINNEKKGHWPTSIFTHLRGGADEIFIGGYTRTPKGKPSPPMGNGEMPKPGPYGVKNIREIIFLHKTNNYGVASYVDQPSCYGLLYYKEDNDQYYMQVGGPGGDCGD